MTSTSQELQVVWGWLIPYFKQNRRRIFIAIWNIDQSSLQYQLHKQPFLAQNWLKWLKIKENPISWEWKTSKISTTDISLLHQLVFTEVEVATFRTNFICICKTVTSCKDLLNVSDSTFLDFFNLFRLLNYFKLFDISLLIKNQDFDILYTLIALFCILMPYIKVISGCVRVLHNKYYHYLRYQVYLSTQTRKNSQKSRFSPFFL